MAYLTVSHSARRINLILLQLNDQSVNFKALLYFTGRNITMVPACTFELHNTFMRLLNVYYAERIKVVEIAAISSIT
jgi:hypothetical protein